MVAVQPDYRDLSPFSLLKSRCVYMSRRAGPLAEVSVRTARNSRLDQNWIKIANF